MEIVYVMASCTLWSHRLLYVLHAYVDIMSYLLSSWEFFVVLKSTDVSDSHFDTLSGRISANTITPKPTNHVQRTRLTTSSTDNHHSLDSENYFHSGCRYVSHQQQNYPHPDDLTVRTAFTSWLKPFTVIS